MGHLPNLDSSQAAGPDRARRLFVYNGGFLTNTRVRRILTLAGYALHLGLPKSGDAVAIWGNSPTAHRGLAVARRRSVPIVRVEDAMLRSLFPGRKGEPPLGLLVDQQGVHFDPSAPTDLEDILAGHPLDDTALLDRARGAIARLQEAHLTKYSAFPLDTPAPEPGYVLVIDQTRGDASVTASGADRARFLEMLAHAQEDHPGARIVIKTHPETTQGFRQGHFGPEDCNDRISLFTDPISPWQLFEGAIAVYAVSSQLGFEAIFAGHKPVLFGQPFYAGWGLTDDRFEMQRRQRKLSRAQLFAGAMLLYPKWYDPHHDRLCEIEDVINTLETRTRAWREDHQGWAASGMRMWKRKPLQQFFGQHAPLVFADAAKTGKPRMIWAGKAGPADADAARIEDGFLRSRGLGAELVPPLSLVVDDLGIYYDPRTPSRLEHLIAKCVKLRPDQDQRVERLIKSIIDARLSKYNLGGTAELDRLPDGRRILVPGQVEDDASIQTGAGKINTNLALLKTARAANPDAVILYKPHPDVETGLRAGKIDATGLADRVLERSDPMALLDAVDEVWTMTSLLGFEALLRGVKVTTTGAPFYAGWGLTNDLGDVPNRRKARPGLNGLVHAALIDYPRYFDPVTNLPCSVEVAVTRLQTGTIPRRGLGNRLLAKLQGRFASYSHLWRRG